MGTSASLTDNKEKEVQKSNNSGLEIEETLVETLLMPSPTHPELDSQVEKGEITHIVEGKDIWGLDQTFTETTDKVDSPDRMESVVQDIRPNRCPTPHFSQKSGSYNDKILDKPRTKACKDSQKTESVNKLNDELSQESIKVRDQIVRSRRLHEADFYASQTSSGGTMMPLKSVKLDNKKFIDEKVNHYDLTTSQGQMKVMNSDIAKEKGSSDPNTEKGKETASSNKAISSNEPATKLPVEGKLLRHYSTESGSNVLNQLRNEGIVPHISSDYKIKGRTSVLLGEWRDINSRNLGDQINSKSTNANEQQLLPKIPHVGYVPAPSCRLKPISGKLQDSHYLNVVDDVLDSIDWDLSKTDADFLTLKQGRHLAYMEKQINASNSGEKTDLHQENTLDTGPKTSMKIVPREIPGPENQTKKQNIKNCKETVTVEDSDHLKQLQDSINRISNIEKMIFDMDLL